MLDENLLLDLPTGRSEGDGCSRGERGDADQPVILYLI